MIQTFAASHIGHRRQRQEDAFEVKHLPGGAILLVLADGMGGHPGGDVAAKAAVKHVCAYFEERYQEGSPVPQQLLREAVDLAVCQVRLIAQEPKTYGAGTTLDAVLIQPNGLARLVHCGDARIYAFWHFGVLHQLTDDHETPDGRLTHCLGGYQDAVDVSTMTIRLDPSDLLFLCSDGLFLHLSDNEIRDIIRDHPEDPALALVTTTLGRGALDNVTVVGARYVAGP